MSFFEDNGPFVGELIFVFIIMSVAIALLTYTDIEVHDKYLLHIGAECYDGNDSTFCQKINEIHNCPNGGSDCILQAYWFMLQVQMFTIAGLMMFVKLGLVKLIGRKINAMRIASAFIWGAAPVILLLSAWEDYLYYVSRGQPIPSVLPWLDHSPIMQGINSLLGVSSTTTLSLYISMAAGAGSIIFLFYLNRRMYKNARLKLPV